MFFRSRAPEGLLKAALWIAVFALPGLLCFLGTPAGAIDTSPNELPRCGTATASYDWQKDVRIEAGGNRGYEDFRKRSDRKNCRKDWTILVFMAADNDLEPYAYWDLYEMEAGYQSGAARGASSTLKSDLVVQLDVRGRDGLRRLHLFQTPEAHDPARNLEDFRNKKTSDIRSPIVDIIPETQANASREKQLEEFLRWGVRNYPSTNLMVIVWGHGQGWGTRSGGGAPGTGGGIALSDDSTSRLSIPALSRVLSKITREERGGRQTEVYASDACLMQMAEVAAEVAPHSRYIIGSSQIQTFQGLPYRRILHELNTGRFNGERAATGGAAPDQPWQEPWWIARMVPDLMEASLKSHGLQGRHDPEAAKTLTLASIESQSLLTQVAPALNHLGSAHLDWIAEDPLRKFSFLNELPRVVSFEGNARELASLLAALEASVYQELELAGVSRQDSSPATRALLAAITEARLSLRMSVVNRVIGPGYYSRIEESAWLQHLQSLSVWVPADLTEYQARGTQFTRSRLWKAAPRWAEWIKRLHGI